jgi:endonuclease YncB( thermonuclease family)
MARIMGAAVEREDHDADGRLSAAGNAWLAKPVPLICEKTGTSYRRITATCTVAFGRNLSCEAIRAGIAVRWARYDPKGWLKDCER